MGSSCWVNRRVSPEASIWPAEKCHLPEVSTAFPDHVAGQLQHSHQSSCLPARVLVPTSAVTAREEERVEKWGRETMQG